MGGTEQVKVWRKGLSRRKPTYQGVFYLTSLKTLQEGLGPARKPSRRVRSLIAVTSGHSFRKEPIQKTFQFSRFTVSLKYKYFRKSIREFSYLFPTLVEKIKICDLEGWIWVLQDLKLIQFGRSFGRHFKIICTK